MKADQIEQLLLYLLIGLLGSHNVQQIDVRISSMQGRHVALLVHVLQVFVKQVLEPIEFVRLNLVQVDVILVEVVVIFENLLLNLVAFRVVQVEVGVRLRCGYGLGVLGARVNLILLLFDGWSLNVFVA